MHRLTYESVAMITTSVASGTAMTAQGVLDASGVALPMSVLLSLFSGVLAGGVSYGILKGRVEAAQARAEESHERHDKTDAKIDQILVDSSRTREMVATLIGELRGRGIAGGGP